MFVLICNRSIFHSYLIRYAIIFVVVGANMYFKLKKIQPEAQFIDHMIKNTKQKYKHLFLKIRLSLPQSIEYKKPLTFLDSNPGPGLGKAEQCCGGKPINEI